MLFRTLSRKELEYMENKEYLKQRAETIVDVMNPMFGEYPFAREGMTFAEFDEENEYLGKHFQEYLDGNYKPLWKQREEG